MGKRIIFSILCLVWAFTAAAQQANFDAKMLEYGLVDVQTLDEEIGVELKYATEDNFVGKNMYGTLKKSLPATPLCKESCAGTTHSA